VRSMLYCRSRSVFCVASSVSSSCDASGKHHRAYVDNMNKAIAGSEMENKTLEEVVVSSWNNGSPTPVFNNAAQVTATARHVPLLTLMPIMTACYCKDAMQTASKNGRLAIALASWAWARDALPYVPRDCVACCKHAGKVQNA